MNKKTVSVQEEAAGSRLDQFLATQDPEHTRGFYQHLIKEGLVSIGNQPVTKASRSLKIGEDIQISYPDIKEFLEPENHHLSIIFEDEHILVINKPAGMAVHPQHAAEQGTVAHALLYHDASIQQAMHDPESAISKLRPGIVHRLDKDTSGLLLIAKSAESLTVLSQQFKEHSVTKEYLAVVYGAFTQSVSLKTGLQRKPFHRTMMGISKKEGEGREAISHFSPLAQGHWNEETLSAILCRIETGRTHQIRVHAKHLHHPILGDNLYTNKPATLLSASLGASRQMLHAYRLAFNHPLTGERLSFTAPLAADIQAVLTKAGAADSLKERGYQ